MNHHLRFARASVRLRRSNLAALALCAVAVPLFTSCQTTGTRLLSVSQSVPPKLAGSKPFLHVQCYFFTAPDDFQLLESTPGVHVAGIYSPQDGEKLVKSLKRKRGFDLTSAPHLTLRQGTSGRLEVIEEFLYPTEYDPPEVKTGSGLTFPDGGNGGFPVTPATPTNFETRNLGIMADFTGRKNSRGEIDFEIRLERSSFLGFVNYGSPVTTKASDALGKPVDVIIAENRVEMPVFDTKRISTTLTLADGHYLALGGLTSTPNLKRITRKPDRGVDPSAGKTFFVLVTVKAIDPDWQ